MIDVPAIPPTPNVGATATVTVGWLTTVGAHVMGWLPGIVTLIGGMMAIGWYTLQFYESKTFQIWYTRHSTARKMRRIAKLEAKQKILSAQLTALQVRNVADETATALVQTAKSEAAHLAVDTEARITAATSPLDKAADH